MDFCYFSILSVLLVPFKHKDDVHDFSIHYQMAKTHISYIERFFNDWHV